MKLNIKKRLVSVVFISAVIVFGLGLGFLLGQNSKICEVCPPQDLDFSLFWETYNKIKERYVDPSKIDEEKLIYGAISGMVDSLDDPYTVFMNPEDSKNFLEDISGRFEGVGMEIGTRDDCLQVISPLENTPAQRAGFRPGDKIIRINDDSTINLSLNEVVNKIRGPKGTTVVLTITRDGWEDSKDIEVERAVIEVPSLKWDLIDGNVAHIKLYQFSEKAGLDFTKAAIEILSSDATKIILDLRNNPGGYLEVARDIAGFFLKKGELVVIEDEAGEQTEYMAKGRAVLLDYPLVVLINKGSASGSEILAGALRDDRGIKLIGENSFGKGSVQQLESLAGGSSVKITIAKWLTPKGETIHGIGLAPDIEVKLTEDDYKAERDPQLDKALEFLMGL